ncbi:aldehyde dehydrogenase family protein, partial [Variovorax sp. Varisp62]|uniref:aldehyde dehydrogenase family protein n=1 Tax=Variovorax sp. Varisp62 TaxID=3243049 RepID=UPI0039B5C34C
MSEAHTSLPVPTEVEQLLQRLGVPVEAHTGGTLTVRSPVSGEVIAQVPQTTPAEATAAIGRAHEAFKAWRSV